MPPICVEVWTLDGCSGDYIKDYVEIDADTCSKNFANGGENVWSWMPIQRQSVGTSQP